MNLNYDKYVKYKMKYLNLKSEMTGGNNTNNIPCESEYANKPFSTVLFTDKMSFKFSFKPRLFPPDSEDDSHPFPATKKNLAVFKAYTKTDGWKEFLKYC